MAAINQQGTSTPVSSLTPDYIGQQFIDTTNDIVYIAYGTLNTEWQEVGAGGGGFGLVTNDYGNLNGGGTSTWDASAGTPLIMKGDQASATCTILIDATTLPIGNTQMIHNKMIVMMGGTSGNLVIGISSALSVANYDFVYIDEFDADNSYQANHTIVNPLNQLYTYDVSIHNIEAVEGGTPVGIVICTKIGQHTLTAISYQGA